MRLQNALKNSIFGVISQVILIVAGIYMQRVMVMYLGNAVIGLNSVFTNIISILSLSEMGVASAIVFNLYEPINHGDTERIASLMCLFKKAYRIIAASVAAAGAVMTFFVHLFVEENEFTENISCFGWQLDSVSFIRFVFVLFVAKTALSYLFSYKRSLLSANQKAYILTGIDLAARLITMGISWAVLIATKSIVWYMVVSIITTVAENILVSALVDRKYPYIKNASMPEKAVRHKVMTDVKNIFIGRLSGTVLNSTDYVVISTFVGVIQSGFYYNYNLIINAVQTVINKILNGLQASIGDMFVEGNRKKDFDILRQLTFIFFWVSVVFGTMIFSVIDLFVTRLWLTAEHRLPLYVVALCMVVFFLICVRGPLWSMLSVSGLFARDKYISLAGTITNLVVSVGLVLLLGQLFGEYWGMFGVFIGTFVSQFLQLILKIRLFFRSFLKMSARSFVLDLVGYFAVFFACAAISYAACSHIAALSFNPWLLAVLCAAVSFVIPNIAVFALYSRAARFKSTLKLVRFFLKRPASS